MGVVLAMFTVVVIEVVLVNGRRGSLIGLKSSHAVCKGGKWRQVYRVREEIWRGQV
jgi:hypothetical protein